MKAKIPLDPSFRREAGIQNRKNPMIEFNSFTLKTLHLTPSL